MEQVNQTLLDKFGRLFISDVRKPVESLYVKDMRHAAGLLVNPEEIDALLSSLTEKDRETLQRIVLSAIDKTFHYVLLLAESEQIEIVMDDKDVAALSDGLTGELYGDHGWLKKFGNL
jgi:hypothetical protein